VRPAQVRISVAVGDGAATRAAADELHRTSLRQWQEVAAPHGAASVRLDLARVLPEGAGSSMARVEAEVALTAFERLGARLDHDAALPSCLASTTNGSGHGQRSGTTDR